MEEEILMTLQNHIEDGRDIRTIINQLRLDSKAVVYNWKPNYRLQLAKLIPYKLGITYRWEVVGSYLPPVTLVQGGLRAVGLREDDDYE